MATYLIAYNRPNLGDAIPDKMVSQMRDWHAQQLIKNGLWVLESPQRAGDLYATLAKLFDAGVDKLTVAEITKNTASTFPEIGALLSRTEVASQVPR